MIGIRRGLLACAWLLCTSLAAAAPDENDAYVLTKPERSLDQIETIYAQMPPVDCAPPEDRWERLPRTASIL